MGYTPTGFSLKIFKERYAFTEDETWEEMSRRVAKQVALSEIPEKTQKYEDKFFDVVSKNLFIPGGRIMANSGRNKPQLLNCFVLANDLDSKEGWGNIAREMIITSMTGGGCGIDFSSVRPRGAEIAGQRGAAPGSVELMKLIDGCAAPIRAGGQRRVALMFSLDLDHPDVEEFLDAKLKNGELENANVSVRSKRTTEFVETVKRNGMWELSWKGKYKREISARGLWNKIVSNAWRCAEPGFLNWELALSESTIWYIADLITTNPCGEIGMPSYDACDLGHLVLFRFIKNGKIDKGLLADTIRTAVRLLDNVLDVNHYPLDQMREMCQKLRRIGLGTTGLADALALVGLKYGSKEGNKWINDVYRFISKQAYEASVMLAIEKGSFEKFDAVKHLQSGYMKRMPHKIKSLVTEHGIRNCALMTQAPVGTGSIVSENCTSGGEPMVPAYERHYLVEDERKMELVFHPLLERYIKEGKDTSHFVSASDLSVREHMEVQAIIQKHVDNAVSKTINMPEDYDMKLMSEVWLEYLPRLKGTTFYRNNSRKAYDKNGKELPPPIVPITIEEAMRRKSEQHQVDVAEVEDCPTGVCKV